MALEVYNAISLGTFSDMDRSDAGNTKSEKSNDLVGTSFGSTTDPLFDYRETVTFDDANNDGTITEDLGATETMSFTGSAPGTTLDSTIQYNVTITYFDGTTATGTVTVLQASTGELFLIGDGNTLLDDGALVSITFDSVANNDFPGFAVSPDRTEFLCFTRGTLIGVERGSVRIETLKVGDLVRTVDNGLQPIRWIGSRTTKAIGKAAPVWFEKGAIGNRNPLVLSPQHRVLVRGAMVQLYFGVDEAIVSAQSMVNGTTITRQEGGVVEYIHLMLDQHELLVAEGIAAESLLLGPQAQRTLETAQLAELKALFPDIYDAGPEPARPILKTFEGMALAALNQPTEHMAIAA